jgi:hypothetical protein
MEHINKVASFDRFEYQHEPISFYFNDDRKCKKNFNLKLDEPAVMLFLNKNVPP